MAFLKKLFGNVNDLKESTEQKEITNKINSLYESIAKGVEELNVKVNSVKELKQKLKNLPPPPPPQPTKPLSSSDVEKKSDEKPEKSENVPVTQNGAHVSGRDVDMNKIRVRANF